VTQPSALRRNELLTIAAFAVLLRIIVFTAAMRLGHLSIDQYTNKGDTHSYLANAAVLCGERPIASMDEYDRRVFPGYPALIAIVHLLGISLPLAALCVTWLTAGAAAACGAAVFEDARVGWAMTCLIPHYLINSSMGMSEAPLLAVVCLALLAAKKERSILAGILFGFAGIIRPMACFAFIGLLLAMIRHRRWSSALVVFITTAATFAVELLLLQWLTGSVLRGIAVYRNHPGAYNGHLLAWPFQSLLTTPALDHASLGRIVYIYLHVVVTLLACGLAALQTLRTSRSEPRAALASAWLIGNTAFVLCIGSVWGFRHFPRFTIPAAPAFFWTVRRVLPRSQVLWGVIAAGCSILAVLGVIDSP
jgi:hypothetical protein